MKPHGMSVKDRIGQRIGRLVVLSRAANKDEGNAIRACWVCRCECGKVVIVEGHNLNRGLTAHGGTRSCGCLRGKTVKHGMAETRIYRIWNQMRQRCTNPRNPAYKRYGARGIKVCERWVKSFADFYADMGDPPIAHTLDRIENNHGYEKANCRWATMKQQGNNRTSNVNITFNGKKQTQTEWAFETGLGKACLVSRLNAGWSLDKALTMPKQFTRAKIERR